MVLRFKQSCVRSHHIYTTSTLLEHCDHHESDFTHCLLIQRGIISAGTICESVYIFLNKTQVHHWLHTPTRYYNIIRKIQTLTLILYKHSETHPNLVFSLEFVTFGNYFVCISLTVWQSKIPQSTTVRVIWSHSELVYWFCLPQYSTSNKNRYVFNRKRSFCLFL